MDLIRFISKRLFAGIFVVLCVSVLLFSVMQLMPGDPITLVSSPRIPAERIQELRQRWGLDQPAHVQYFYWLRNVLKGDFGTSITTGQKVATLVWSRFPATMILMGFATAIEYFLSLPFGLIAASRGGGRFDRGVILSTIFFSSIPPFFFGILLMLVFGIWLSVVPISGYMGFKSIIMPALTLSLPYMAWSMRLTRTEVLEMSNEKYVVTAHAKGLSERGVWVKHVLRNALIPVTIMFFLNVPWMIGGSVVVENVFAWPGMGRLLYKSISTQDYPVVQGIVLIIAILTVLCNLLGDIVSGILDPRIRLE